MRRVLPDKRGMAGLGACGHQPGTLGRPPQTERQQEWAGTPVHQTAWDGRGKHQAAGRSARPGVLSRFGQRLLGGQSHDRRVNIDRAVCSTS